MLFALIAAAAATSPVSDAQAVIRGAMKDPAAVQFQKVVRKPGAVCGEYNAKNGYGAYTGFRSFVYRTDEGRVYTTKLVILDRSGVVESADTDVEPSSFEDLSRMREQLASVSAKVKRAFEVCSTKPQ